LFLSSQQGAAFFTTLSAFVLKRELQARTVLEHFAVLDLYIQLHNLCNAQIPQRTSGGLNCILCRILPGLGTCADYFSYSVDLSVDLSFVAIMFPFYQIVLDFHWLSLRTYVCLSVRQNRISFADRTRTEAIDQP
jgi:hypothetical protein